MSYHSDFWLTEYDDWDFTDNVNSNDDDNHYNDDDTTQQSERTKYLIKLSSARRAIANYVSILTNRNIPVLFNDSNLNCTDGSTIYIGSELNKRADFDVSVGLALHESSHIKYSDFNLFKTVWMSVPRKIYDLTEDLGISKERVGRLCKDMYNYVEDRYIDYTVYTNAPGYRGYYEALYDRYFNTPIIADALKSELYRKLNITCYEFRIINLTNPSTDLNALPGLAEIARVLDLTNIKRLEHSKNRLDLAFEIVTIIFKNIKETTLDDSNIPGINKNESVGDDSSDDDIDDIDNILGGETTSVESVDDDDIGSDEKISKTKLSKLKKLILKQKDFLDGSLSKKKVSKTDKEVLDALEKSKIELVDVGHEYTKQMGVITPIECIFVRNMTRELLMSDQCPMSIIKNSAYGDISDYLSRNRTNIDAGIVLGTKIGRRLQIRNEVNTHKFTRRSIGKLDRKLIHELGFSDQNIFYTTLTEKYKKVNFHISVDASSSMNGNKWNKAIKLCVALAKATSMLENIHVTISFRSTYNKLPYIMIAYDSSVDKFEKIKNLFPYLKSEGTTPEGLCYEALLSRLPENNSETNSYFINISDGEPFFMTKIDKVDIHYSDEPAAAHTRSQVKKIRNAGYNVISYFISEYNDPGSKTSNIFRKMYGDDSNFINTDSMNQILNTLNKKMLDAVDIS